MRKMKEHPREGWTPVLCLIESADHPIDCVKTIFNEMDSLKLRSAGKVRWEKFKVNWNQLVADASYGNWKLPQLQTDWKSLLFSLFEDAVGEMDTRLLVMLDEFPQVVQKIKDKHGAETAIEFVDTLRELRQRWESSGKIRLILSGSIGFHLVLNQLRSGHGYKGKPTNDMKPISVYGMKEDETALMCMRYLEEEGISRNAGEFDAHMYEVTDGLPLYIQHVCGRFQESDPKPLEVRPADVDRELDEMMNDPKIEWFRNTEDRIRDYYAPLGKDDQAYCILDELSRRSGLVPEAEIIEYVNSQMDPGSDRAVIEVLDLLWRDHYLHRDVFPPGGRSYGFMYKLMRKWWRANRG